MNHKFGNELPSKLLSDSGEFSSPSGRGLPAGWLANADEKLCAAVRYRLVVNEDVDASAVEVRCVAGEITLEGTVDGFQESELVAAIATAVPGVKHVHNALRTRHASSEAHCS